MRESGGMPRARRASVTHPWDAISFVGDAAVLFECGFTIDVEVNRAVHRIARAVETARIDGVWGIVPAYASVLVEFDPRRTSALDVIARIEGLPFDTPDPVPRRFRVPAWYGGEHGPDLDDVARRVGLAPGDVVAHHAEREYRIYCVGFAPGQPLCATVAETLRLPRRDTPRTAVPPGSIAIAEAQTTIYTMPTPGGWHLIARTPVRIFDPYAEPPVPWRAGDVLRFVPERTREFGDPRAVIERDA